MPSNPKPPFLDRIRWFNLLVLTLTPLGWIYGCFTTPLTYPTLIFSIVYYFITLLGITAGYHRLWSHRSYTASYPLSVFLALAGAGAVQGSIKWWARGHRSHHRYTDTELDPYSAPEGFWYTHIGWQLLKPLTKPGAADVSDLSRDRVVKWQHKYYFWLVLVFGYLGPVVLASLIWGDPWGGWFYGSLGRMTIVHHCTFLVNSLAHFHGTTPFSDTHTPRDSALTAILTLGEGYHNFHHEFPTDYRNAIKWYQYDPTKWFIWVCSKFGLARSLRTFPENEIKKGQLGMELKRLRRIQEGIDWPKTWRDSDSGGGLPMIDWDEFKQQSQTRSLILISGYIHDVSSFLSTTTPTSSSSFMEYFNHPGGAALINQHLGKDATAAFHGGVYQHSSAAHNLLSMMRVGVLQGGMEIRGEGPHSNTRKRTRSTSRSSTSSSEGPLTPPPTSLFLATTAPLTATGKKISPTSLRIVSVDEDAL